MLSRVHLVATGLWSVLAGGAGAGFLARDALGLGQPLVAIAWVIGAGLPVVVFGWRRGYRPGRPSEHAQGRHSEGGKATVEFAALVLLASLALGALAS